MPAIFAADAIVDDVWTEDIYQEVVASVLDDAAKDRPSSECTPLCCVLPALPASSLSKHSAGKPVCISYGNLLRISAAALSEGEDIKNILLALPHELAVPLATEQAPSCDDEIIVTTYPTSTGDTVAVGIRPADYCGRPIAQIFCLCDSETALENLDPKGIDLNKEIRDALALIAEICRMAQLGVRFNLSAAN